MSEPTIAGATGRRAWRSLLLALLACALLVLAYHLRAILTPLIVALVLAYIANPAVTALEKRRVPRTLTIAGFYVVFLGAAILLVLLGVPALVDQGAAFCQEIFVGEPLLEDPNGNGVFDPGDSFEDLNHNKQWDGPRIARVLAWSQRRLKELTGSEDIVANLRRLRATAAGKEGDIAQSVAKALEAVLSWFATSVGGLLHVVSFVLLLPVYLFFILKHMNQIWERTRAAIPAAYRERVVGTLTRIHRANAAFFRGQVTIALIEGTILFVVLTALGVRFSFLFAALYAVLALIPYVGVATTFAVTTLFVFVDGGGFSRTLLLTIGLFVFVQLLEAFALQPFILGKETGLHPVAVILAILIFGDLFGFFGVLLAIPLASATIIVAQDYLVPIVQEVTEAKETA